MNNKTSSEALVTEEQNHDVAVEEAAQAKTSAGKVLAAARESIGLSVADAARQLRLSPRQIEALEADDYARLPGKTFLRGFIRNYAKLLQIDPEPLLVDSLEMNSRVQSIIVPSSQVEFGGKRRLLPFGDRPPKPWVKYGAMGLAAVLVLSWVGYELLQRQPAVTSTKVEAADEQVVKFSGETTLALPLPQAEQAPAAAAADAPIAPVPATAAAQTPATAPVAAPAQAPAEIPKPAFEASGPRLLMVFDGDSWVEIRDKSGKTIFSQLNPKGSQQQLRLSPPFSLVVGNAAHVKLSYNEKPVDLTPHIKVDVARLTIE